MDRRRTCFRLRLCAACFRCDASTGRTTAPATRSDAIAGTGIVALDRQLRGSRTLGAGTRIDAANSRRVTTDAHIAGRRCGGLAIEGPRL